MWSINAVPSENTVELTFTFQISDPSLEEKFWLVHGIIKVYPLSEGLNQVKEFLKNSEDIIIWQTGGFEQV